MNQVILGVAVVLTIAVAVNLLLTFAVIRRLAAVTARHPGEPEGPGPRMGHRVAEFTAPLLAGGTVSRADLTGVRTSAVFISPGCPPCDLLVSTLKSGAGGLSGPLLAFIAGSADDADVQRAAADLAAVARDIAVIDEEGPVAAAFGVAGYPTVLSLADGVVTTAGTRLESLTASRLPAHA